MKIKNSIAEPSAKLMIYNRVVITMNRLVKKLEKIGRDPKVTAKAAGLRYVADSVPGYTRKRSGKGFGFYDADGKPVKDKELIARFTKLVIPPAYTFVFVGYHRYRGMRSFAIYRNRCRRKEAKYRYHPDWNKLRNQSKYYHLRLFAIHLPDYTLPGG